MIHLINVSHMTADEQHVRHTLLRDVSLSVPINRTIGIFASDPAIASGFLRLIAGTSQPEFGRVLNEGVEFSPIVHLNGRPGQIIIPQLNLKENVQTHARMNGIDVDHFRRLIEQVCDFGHRSVMPSKTYNWPMKRTLEVALIAATPYDCYLVDRFDLLNIVQRNQLIHAARLRGAGLIFASKQKYLLTRLSERIYVLKDGKVHLRGAHPVRGPADE
jgi:capsular polysaccharide transport system ATP-binding protein